MHEAVSKTEAIVRNATDAILVFTLDSLRIISANPGATVVFGYSDAALACMRLPELLDLAEGGRPGSPLLRAAQTEIEGRRPNGDRIILEAMVTRASGRNGDFYIGTFRDISDRKRFENELRQAEENFRGIFENAVEGMFRTTPQGVYLQANPALARIYGFQSPSELMTYFRDIGAQLYVDSGRRDEFAHLLRERDEIFDFESAIPPQGRQRALDFRERPRGQDEHGAILYRCCR